MAGRTISASEVGQFAFCARAWWYARQGYPSSSGQQFEEGLEAHRRHGRGLRVARGLRRVGYACLAGGLIVLALHLLALGSG